MWSRVCEVIPAAIATRRAARGPTPALPPGEALLDDSAVLPLRVVLGTLLAGAREADVAITRFRLAGIDLRPDELGRMRRCRILVGRLDADSLSESGDAVRLDPGRRAEIEGLARLARSGVVHIRASGPWTWTPDFSVFRAGTPEASRDVCLVGAHHFGQPYAHGGPAFTCTLTHEAAVRRAARHFQRLWDAGYDIMSVVVESLDAALRNE